MNRNQARDLSDTRLDHKDDAVDLLKCHIQKQKIGTLGYTSGKRAGTYNIQVAPILTASLTSHI